MVRAKKAPKKTKSIEPADEFEQKALAIVAPVSPLERWLEVKKLTSEEAFEDVSTALAIVKTARNQLKSEIDEIKKPLNKARNALIKKHKVQDGPLAELERHMKDTLVGPWLASLRAKEEKEAERRAKKLEAKGELDAAQDTRMAASQVDFTENVRGMSQRDRWVYECDDLLLLVKAVAAGKAPLAAVEVAHTWMSQKARDLKEEQELYPGVRIVNRPVIAVSGGR